MKFLQATLSLGLLSAALGFQARSPLQQASSKTTSSLKVLPVEHLNDVHSVLTDSSAFSFLADAAAAAVAPEVDAVKDPGLWDKYINLFKIALNGIHDVIDGPLNKAGITETWGISIAIFTACKYFKFV